MPPEKKVVGPMSLNVEYPIRDAALKADFRRTSDGAWAWLEDERPGWRGCRRRRGGGVVIGRACERKTV